jgi:hypothetical protein
MSRSDSQNDKPQRTLKNLWHTLTGHGAGVAPDHASAYATCTVTGKAGQRGETPVADTHDAAHAADEISSPPIETVEVEDTDESMFDRAATLTHTLAERAGEAGRTVAHKVGETAAATQTAARNAAEMVDPAAVGGAVAAMSAGEIIGGVIGGVLGAAAGPGGAILGAEMGAFAGTSIGAKLGYDVTHEVVHPEDAKPDASFDDRVRGVAKTLATRTGDSIGGGAGAAGGAMVGTILAGPIGGEIGAFVGEAIAGELGEKSAVDLYAKAEQKIDESLDKPPAENTSTPALESSDTNRNSLRDLHGNEWLQNAALGTVSETSAEAILSTVGGVVAGELGRKLGKRAALVAARHVDWSEVSSSVSEGVPKKKALKKPRKDNARKKIR